MSKKKELNLNEMTRKEIIEGLPERKWDGETVCDSLIILPTRKIHDSGFRCMEFVAVKDGKAVCLISGNTDIINIDGIGGYGKWFPKMGIPSSLPPKGWRIDCLRKSGLLRLFANKKLLAADALSSFSIYTVEDLKKEKEE